MMVFRVVEEKFDGKGNVYDDVLVDDLVFVPFFPPGSFESDFDFSLVVKEEV